MCRSILILVFCILLGFNLRAQQCKNCPTPTVIKFFDIDWSSVPPPNDTSLIQQWNKLAFLTAEMDVKLDMEMQNDEPCAQVIRVGSSKDAQLVSLESSGVPAYRLSGKIQKAGSNYELRLQLQPSCTNEVLTEIAVQFQLYPELDLDKLVSQTAQQFSGLLNIQGFELKERERRNLPIARSGRIIVDVRDFGVKPGGVTRVDFVLRDCDGHPLKNQVISFEGTSGGSITPAKVTTNDLGFASANFKLGSSQRAFIKAQCVTKNVTGCNARFVGSETLLRGMVKVEIEYEEVQKSVVDWKKANPFAVIKASGGEDFELTSIKYNSIFYHKPSAEARKKNYLVFNEKRAKESFGSVSQYWHEAGTALYSRNKQAGVVGVEYGGLKYNEEDKGSNTTCSGNATEGSAEVIFSLGDAQTPAAFDLALDFLISDDCEIGGGISVSKGQNKNQVFTSKKITDPKSPYKTEYTIVAFEDVHEGFMEGQKAIGLKLDGIGNLTGYKVVTVKIFSPY